MTRHWNSSPWLGYCSQVQFVAATTKAAVVRSVHSIDLGVGRYTNDGTATSHHTSLHTNYVVYLTTYHVDSIHNTADTDVAGAIVVGVEGIADHRLATSLER